MVIKHITATKNIKLCDDCGGRVTYNSQYDGTSRDCIICNKDLCDKCAIYQPVFEAYVCQKCEREFHDELVEIQNLEDDCDKKISKLNEYFLVEKGRILKYIYSKVKERDI